MELEELDLFTTSTDETIQIASSLHGIGCCVRCILRLLGESRPDAYGYHLQELEKMLLPKDALITSSENGVCPCPACLGILQKFASKSFFEKIYETVKEGGYEFTSQQCSLILPVSLIVRQKALYVYLQKEFGSVYIGKEDSIASVKDVWKWTCGRSVAEILQAQFQARSSFDILMTFDYVDSDKECSFLLDAKRDTFRQRKQRKYGFETFTRANVAKALSQMTESAFEDYVSCPPRIPTSQCTCDIKCSHDAIFIAGRYMKYSRVLSQTPWIVEGKRVMEGSVEELICDPMHEMFRPSDHRLSSSGREDVDVRMLGLGRPFVIELINPHRTKFSAEHIAELQEKINRSSEDVQVRDLQIVTRDDTTRLKEGEIDKAKVYSALCWCEKTLTQADLNSLNAIKELTIHQKTPLRVLHRRSAATRDRLIHSMEATNLGNNRFKLSLRTQAGTYIKEFVHGDFGRTSPNMTELVGAECDITDLDVEAVDVDWPPFLDPVADKSSSVPENGFNNSDQAVAHEGSGDGSVILTETS